MSLGWVCVLLLFPQKDTLLNGAFDNVLVDLIANELCAVPGETLQLAGGVIVCLCMCVMKLVEGTLALIGYEESSRRVLK